MDIEVYFEEGAKVNARFGKQYLKQPINAL